MEKELNTNETINSQKPALPKKFGIFSVCYAAVAYAFMIVMWATGWNFFPLVAVVLAAVSALLILLSVIKWNKMPVFLWVAFLTLIVGTVLFHLGHSAESFGKSLWWNLVLTIAPIGLAVVIKLVKIEGKRKKIAMAVCAGLMAATSMVYFLFMNLRLNPTVERLWEGHDDYLNSLDPSMKETNSPNVLFILMDDMAYADISSYSYMAEGEATINTPNIDSIAENGIFMENFYASAPVCTPSRFTALTGRYASRGYIDNVIFPTVVDGPTFSPTHFLNPYQFLHNVDGILGDEITIAEALDEMGYDTSCVGKWNLGDYGEYLPTNQGFDYFYGSYYVNDMTPYDWVEEVDGVGTQIRSHGDNKDQSETTRLLTDKVNEQINESISNGNNFFMYYATPWPHHPIYSDNNGNGKGDVTDDNYIDCIEEFDKGLGEIIQNLKDKGVYDDTLIVFTSDNGPGREGVAGNLRGRKNTTFEGGMKVPMLVSYPNGGVGAGSAIADTTYPITDYDGNVIRYATTKKVETSAMLQDLFPTILNYVMGDDYKLPTDRIIDGVSLKSVLSGNMPSDFRVHDVLYYMKRGKIQGLQMAVDTPSGTFDFKYYDNVHSENSAFIDQFYKNYLFNLDTDPAEGYNIAKKNPEIASMMKEQLISARKDFSSNRRGKI